MQFSSLGVAPSDFSTDLAGHVFSDPSRTEPGFGGRFTYNLNRTIAFEAAGNFFPHRNFSGLRKGGRALQGQFGVKIGKRFQRFGVFGKVRPGFVTFSEVSAEAPTGGVIIVVAPDIRSVRKSHFSTEIGGVVEFYPSRRIVVRFEAGDTMIHYGRLPQFPVGIESPSIDTSARLTHNFQISSGVGFRLMAPQQNEIATPQGHRTRRRFEAGGQFSSLTFSIKEHYLSLSQVFYYKKSELGFGGRFGFNLTDRIAIEAETNFLSGDVNNVLNNGRLGGRALQVQAGVKAAMPPDVRKVSDLPEPPDPSLRRGYASEHAVEAQPLPNIHETDARKGGALPHIGAAEPHKNARQLRGDLDNIVLKALRKEPQRRYASVEQFSEDIRRHVEGLPVSARKDTLAYRTSKFIQRNKIGVAAAAIVLLTLVGGIVATTVEARRVNRRFNEVRQLAHSVLFDYNDEIAALPGSTKVRERLVKDALQYLDNLSKDAGKDVSLLRELADAYEKVAAVQGSVVFSSRGTPSTGQISETGWARWKVCTGLWRYAKECLLCSLIGMAKSLGNPAGA